MISVKVMGTLLVLFVTGVVLAVMDLDDTRRQMRVNKIGKELAFVSSVGIFFTALYIIWA